MKNGRYSIGEISRLCCVSISKLRYLDERGMERSDFLDAMQPDVTSLPALQSKMISLYPSRAMTIEQVFFRYK